MSVVVVVGFFDVDIELAAVVASFELGDVRTAGEHDPDPAGPNVSEFGGEAALCDGRTQVDDAAAVRNHHGPANRFIGGRDLLHWRSGRRRRR